MFINTKISANLCGFVDQHDKFQDLKAIDSKRYARTHYEDERYYGST